MQILIVEDDVRLARALAHILEENGYGTDVVHDGATGLAWAESGRYDVIVLDVMCRRRRVLRSGRPAARGREHARAAAHRTRRSARQDHGPRQRRRRLHDQALLPCRAARAPARAHPTQGEVLFEKLPAGDLELNLESHDLTCSAKSIHLSYKEFCLAKVLMANTGAVVSKDLLIEKVWGVESTAEDNNVEAYVSFLRKKMKFLGSTARIETLRRAGYRFSADTAPHGEDGPSC